MAKADVVDGNDGDYDADNGTQPDTAKLKVTKGGSPKQKMGNLNSGLKRKSTRGGIAKPAVAKGMISKKGF